jgi:GntP family gluconate:H+ symporter
MQGGKLVEFICDICNEYLEAVCNACLGAPTHTVIGFYGVIVGIALAIILIIKKLNPVMSLFLGAVVGAIVGGSPLFEVLRHVIISGTATMMPVVVRILAAGVMVGVLIESGSAEVIAATIVKKLGAKRAVLAITLSCMVLTAVGIFNTISIVMLSPLAISVARRTGITKMSMLLALSGGSKAGNIISPNPNAVAAAEAYGLHLSEVMIGGFIPALFGLTATVIIAGLIKKKGPLATDADVTETDSSQMPSFRRAIAAPAIAISLLVISPIGYLLGIEFLSNLQVDAFFILPVAAIIGSLILGKGKKIKDFANSGVQRMIPVAMLLVGAGTVGGLITHSEVPDMLAYAIVNVGMPPMLLAPISTIVMAAAVSSAVTGLILGATAFADTIVAFGVAPVAGAVMQHAGCMVIDVMPHGNIFLASKESMRMATSERIKLIPYEAAIGFIQMLAATIMYGIILA